MRLDYYLAHATDLSRKDAKRAIQQGRVRVAGEVEMKTAATVTAGADISLDGKPLTLEQGHRYFMLNKPAGVVSATADGLHRTVLDLLPHPLRRDLHPVGRLDRDTTGLLLLTTDGPWSHRITSPRRGCAKVYRANLADPLGAEALAQLEAGVTLRSEAETTRPARVEVLDECTIRLTLTEGRYHQVKRMLAAVGNHVTGLHRERVGAIELDQELAPGAYRALSAVEIDSV
jgi:16S rRNA pseudouridine516 synthase